MAIVLYPNGSALDIIDLIRTNLVNCKVGLFQNQVNPTPSIVLGDLVVADFSGYAAITVAALLPAYIDPAGGASAQIATVQFDHTGGIANNVCFGFFVETMGGDLVLVGSFDDGVPMSRVGDSLPLDIKFSIGN